MALDVDFTHPLRSYDAALSLRVGDAVTTALVGPSGAGKTTVLRVVAGLLRPRRGIVALDDERWLDTEAGIDVPPERRSVGYLFQEYALFPHLDVLANVRFGVRRGSRVDDLLERLRIGGLRDARIRELSGGERQRVALARALAHDPSVLLLDEPLSALDAHTKAEVRSQLRDLLHDLALPTILVTHDFEDAAALADRIGVIVDGRILQYGSPAELVAAPADGFVASFTGATLLEGTAQSGANGLTEVILDGGGTAWSTEPGSGRVGLAIYPWEVSLSRDVPEDSTVNHIRATVASVVPLGNRARVRVGPLVAEVTEASVARLGIREGEAVVASFKATAARVLPLRD
jgi:ABC-type sulfate/molybdate transport systems ATPase subunit